MIKNIKCSQCKYLREFCVSHEDGNSYHSFWCEADRSIELNENNVRQFRECSFFRSRTQTVWEEVRRDIIQKLKEIFKKIKININP